MDIVIGPEAWNQKKPFVLIENEWILRDSPVVEEKISTGRPRCRICGQKIQKGELEYSFFFSTTDGGSYNPWTAISGHVHKNCAPHAKTK